MPQHITVTEYNPAWEEMFKEESAVISEILGDNCIFVHHIGSYLCSGTCSKTYHRYNAGRKITGKD